MTTTSARSLSCAETAKYLRAALKQAFPGVTFNVRSKTYAGGASIDVSWTDGPTTKAVEAVANRFNGSDFDATIDLKQYRWHYLTRDGQLVEGGTQGTEGSMGTIAPEQHPIPLGAMKVHLGADYIFCQRQYSTQAEAIVKGRAAYWSGFRTEAERPYHDTEDFHRAAAELDFTPVLRGGKPILRPVGLDARA